MLSWTDLSNPAIRQSWAALFPAACVALLLVYPFIPWTSLLPLWLRQSFAAFLPIGEAEIMDNDTSSTKPAQGVSRINWKNLLICSLTVVQTLSWCGFASYTLIAASEIGSDVVITSISSYLIGIVWLYPTIFATLRPVKTALPNLFVTYLLQFFGSVLLLGGRFYDHYVKGAEIGRFTWVAQAMNFVIALVLLGVVLSLPVVIPGREVDKREIGNSISPEDYCSLLRWMTFHWVYPLIRKGHQTTLNESDIWNLSLSNQSRLLFERYSNTPASSLMQKIWICNSFDIIRDVGLALLAVPLAFMNPYYMNKILTVIDTPNPTPENTASAYIYAILMFLFALAKALSQTHHLWYARRAVVRIRSELMAGIYDKALKRKDFSGIVNQPDDKGDDKKEKDNKPQAGANEGTMVNLMATDASKVAEVFDSFYALFTSPLELIIGAIFLYELLGIAAFIGFSVLILFTPIHRLIVKQAVKIQQGLSTSRDRRMAVVTELISSIKFIKFFAWEDQWVKKAMDARNEEISWIIKSKINSLRMTIIWVLPPALVSIISFFVYVALGNTLTVSTAFTSIALFTMIRIPVARLPSDIMGLLECKVSLDRLAKFLEEEEVSEQVSSLKKSNNHVSHDKGLGLEHATCRWNAVSEREEAEGVLSLTRESSAISVESQDSIRFELKDISVLFPEGKMTVITGPTASGKTALLMAVLGELTLVSGRIIMSKDTTVVLPGGLTQSISYAGQTPWLRHQSIRDNIIFDSEWDEQRYDQVVECCALKPDFDILEDGDQTEIGVKGVSLSGGQKARVALARAVYARTKYVLLDDPLSAVDSHTAHFLFGKLLCGPLLQERTVVMVTHHVELVLPGAFYLIRMLDGRIDTQGTVKDLRAQGVLEDIKHDATVQVINQEQAMVPEDTIMQVATKKPTAGSPVVTKKPRQLVQDEHRETGDVKLSIYMAYIGAASYYLWAVVAIFTILSQMTTVGEKYWIKEWGEAYSSNDSSISSKPSSRLFVSEYVQVPLYLEQGVPSISKLPEPHNHPFYYIGIYAAIGMATAFTMVLADCGTYIASVQASRKLFRQLLTNIVGAKMRWHDVTPQGRILNRFGKDIQTIDSNLPDVLQTFNTYFTALIAAVLTVVFFFPWFIIPAFILALIYRELMLGYLDTGRDLRRMESVSRSPIFSDFGEVLEGIVTVRAFSAEKRFLRNIHKKIDKTTQMFYFTWMTNRWLLLNFDAISSVAVFITNIFALSGYASPGTAGLCITSALTFTGRVYWVCRMWTALELDLNCVERVVEYLHIPEEPATVIESNRPPAYWPSSSSIRPLISVENLSVKYAPELPSVLRDISFSVNARERIGLLGRTGSGKSTLAMSLLRFVDPASGRILVDGIDISTIGTHDLRSRLTFIPQDATLFSGTLRENLDPFHEHEDRECLDVLYRVHLINHSAPASRRLSRVSSALDAEREAASASDSIVSASSTEVDSKVSLSLDTLVSAGGSNFSQGQRQLIAMARALLRRSSIIILDEATSSIDFETDAKIQATIREEFNDSLLLTVAHRLRTVIDYDRLLVLDNGQVAEFDTPYNLIQKENGIFRNMCLKSGSFRDLENAVKLKADSTK